MTTRCTAIWCTKAKERLDQQPHQAFTLKVFRGAAFVNGQLADLDQSCARHVATQPKQRRRVHLVVVADSFSSASLLTVMVP